MALDERSKLNKFLNFEFILVFFGSLRLYMSFLKVYKMFFKFLIQNQVFFKK
jgi:hypothetical protein